MNINTAEYWNNIFATENEWRVYPFTNEIVLHIVESGSKVLELGCGTGVLAEQIHKQAYYVGYDISKVAVEKARNKEVNAFVADVLTEEFPQVDLVVALEFLEHFTDKELKILMTKIVEASQKAVFAVPNDCLGNDTCKEHYQKWNKDSFKEFLSKYYDDVSIIDYKDTTSDYKVELDTLFAECSGGKK